MYIVQNVSSAHFKEVVGLPVAELTILLPTFAFQNLLRPTFGVTILLLCLVTKHVAKGFSPAGIWKA